MDNNPLYQRDIISINDLSLKDVQLILKMTQQLKQKPHNDLLKYKIIANCFFEPSTRTRLSFAAAAMRLGGKVLGFSSDENLSTKKGETLSDTIRVVSEYADLLVIRHAQEGAARLAAEISNKPVINAGDGGNQHPSQALVDLFTIQEAQEKIDGLNIAIVGDLKYARTAHSFAQICMLFNVRLYLISEESMMLPEVITDNLRKNGVRFSFHRSLEEIVPKVDILYMTRIQQERLEQGEYKATENSYVITPALLKNAKSNLKILHPLPRINEISAEVDKMPYALYFTQAANGMYVRQALLTLLLNEQLP